MTDMMEFPEELIDDFMLEIGEHSEVIEEALLHIESGKGTDGVDGIFRSVHSIKGSASWVGFKKTVELCHNAEELLNDVRKRGASMSSKRVDLLFAALDIVKAVQCTGKDEHEGIDPCIGRISELRNSENAGKRSGGMRDEVDIWKKDEGDLTVVMIEGDLGMKGTDQLISEFVKLEDDGRYRLILDIEKISFICSSGLGGLAITLKNLREKDGDLKLVNPTGDVKEKLEITELNRQFDICGSVKEAMSRF